MKYDELYKKLLENIMPFGYENKLLEQIKAISEPYSDESWFDECGSLIVRKKGPGKRIMLTAQVDVPTLVITYIEQDNRARFFLTGKATPQIGISSKIIFTDGSLGVIDSEDKHCKDTEIKKMFVRPIDGIFHVGQRGVLCGDTNFIKTGIHGPHCGNIGACIALLDTMQNLHCKEDMYYVFTVGSEAQMISQRGVLGAVFNISPQAGISIEALSVKSNSYYSIDIGMGPVVCLRDEHALISNKLLLSIRDYEDTNKKTIQYVALNETGRETALHHISSHGAVGATLCIPVDGQNTKDEMVMFQDINETSVLIQKLIPMMEKFA